MMEHLLYPPPILKPLMNEATALFCSDNIPLKETVRRLRDKTYRDFHIEDFKGRFNKFYRAQIRDLWYCAEEFMNVKTLSLAGDFPVSAWALADSFPNLETVEIRFGSNTSQVFLVKKISGKDFKEFYSKVYMEGDITEDDFKELPRNPVYKKVPYDEEKYPGIIPIHPEDNISGTILHEGYLPCSCILEPEEGLIQVGVEIQRLARHCVE